MRKGSISVRSHNWCTGMLMWGDFRSLFDLTLISLIELNLTDAMSVRNGTFHLQARLRSGVT